MDTSNLPSQPLLPTSPLRKISWLPIYAYSQTIPSHYICWSFNHPSSVVTLPRKHAQTVRQVSHMVCSLSRAVLSIRYRAKHKLGKPSTYELFCMSPTSFSLFCVFRQGLAKGSREILNLLCSSGRP